MSTVQSFVLSNTTDWDAWIFFVRSRATYNGIWELIDPDLTERPVALEKPIKPLYVMPKTDADFNIVTYNAYKARKEIHETDRGLYEQQRNAFGDVLSFIQETIAPENVMFIQNEELHPWNQLRALKRRLAPSENERRLQIEGKYHELCKGPDGESMDDWLKEWVTTYTDAIEFNVAAIIGAQPIRDFLLAVQPQEKEFADAQLNLLGQQGPCDCIEIIAEFINYRARNSDSDSSTDSDVVSSNSEPLAT